MGGTLSWLHFGDLHVTGAEQDNCRDFRALVAEADAHLAGAVDFAVLPGDNADDGTAAQFALVRDAAAVLRLPLHILPGDHDFKPRSLDAFHAVLGADRLPKAATVSGHRCLFLDVVSAGKGGPDFRLGDRQIAWLEQEVTEAARSRTPVAVFMHTYPADLGADAARVRSLFARAPVLAVDMGHTHYNELANDGRTIFAATRSTGQIEEGPVGFALAAIDRGVVSWRFKELASPWPFVLITSPADHRLVTNPAAPDQLVQGAFEARALAWSGRGIVRARCRIDDGPWRVMEKVPGTPSWRAACAAPGQEFSLTVEAEDAEGGRDRETIRVASGRYEAPPRRADGSDADAIGPWPEKGILGTRLGPNRNGRKW